MGKERGGGGTLRQVKWLIRCKASTNTKKAWNPPSMLKAIAMTTADALTEPSVAGTRCWNASKFRVADRRAAEILGGELRADDPEEADAESRSRE